MKFQDIPAEKLSIRVKRTDAGAELKNEIPVYKLRAHSYRDGEFEVVTKDAVILVKPVVARQIATLNRELASGCAILARLVNPAHDGSIELQIAFLAGECLDMNHVDIAVDEYAEEKIERIDKRKYNRDDLHKRLRELCCFIQDDDREYFFLTTGLAIDEDLKDNKASKKVEGGRKEDQEEEVSDDMEMQGVGTRLNANESEAALPAKPEPTLKNSFCISGDGIRFVATNTMLPNGKLIYIVTRLHKGNNEPDGAIRLAKGKLRFVDRHSAEEIEEHVKTQMATLTNDNSSYLKRWEDYGVLEGDQLINKARKIIALQYTEMDDDRNRRFSATIVPSDKGKADPKLFEEACEVLAAHTGEYVEAVESLPDYLLENKTYEQLREDKESLRGNKDSSFKVIEFDYDSKCIILDAEDKDLPSKSGRLILSLTGEITQIERRLNARRRILAGRAVNPQLGLLLEEKGQIAKPDRRPPKIQPLTAFVREKVFPKNPPTPKQREAIEIALNTPDIALIQGPPGTGKTTVIAAICERINEMADKRSANAKGQILLTGFQHDAVENMIDRIKLNGIPIPKFGRHSGAKEDDQDVFEKELDELCNDIAGKLRERNPQFRELDQEKKIKGLCLQYVQAPTRNLAVALVKEIEALGVRVLGTEVSRQASNLAKLLSHEQSLGKDVEQRLHFVRRLRSTPRSFSDDGSERAEDALFYLKNENAIDDGDCQLLEDASRSYGAPSEFLMNKLTTLKSQLLDKFTPLPVFRVEKQNAVVVALAEEAIRRIKIAGRSTLDAKSVLLHDFLADLESNALGMRDAVRDYSIAFAATCQQSARKDMQKEKGLKGDDETNIKYEYVIVDETARVSPPDLMVAMSQGKRIILVGDHRQLPHIVNELVAREMVDDNSEAGLSESDWLKKSMFEYLFSDRLKTLEENDGVPRRVTLDIQYRMHPVLGDFISRNFYEPYDKNEKFISGRSPSDFAHNLPRTDGLPAVWLDVNAMRGSHRREGTSLTRQAEAIAIKEQLKVWMDSDAGKDLTYGIISFYKAQADLIKKYIKDDGKKLRIGTVDSFQGMEFDVVFLSIVRVFPNAWNPKTEDPEKQARGLFGHLCLYNRLNVSMSRQKKLLVVVGDSELVQNDLAKKYIPGLVDFYNLCQTEGRVLSCH